MSAVVGLRSVFGIGAAIAGLVEPGQAASCIARPPLQADSGGAADVQYVWRFLRAQKIDLAARKSWCESNDPAFVAMQRRLSGFILTLSMARCADGGREAIARR
jgi:hypothetical protein